MTQVPKGVDLTAFEVDLFKAAKDNGLKVKRCSPVHFHLQGVYLLNVYPTTRSVYIQGTNHKASYKTIPELVLLAKGEADLKGVHKGTRRQGPTKHRRRILWDKGERTCFVCGARFAFFEETTLEHKIPLFKGGSERPDNLALSHEKCNQDRGHSLAVNRKLEAMHEIPMVGNSNGEEGAGAGSGAATAGELPEAAGSGELRPGKGPSLPRKCGVHREEPGTSPAGIRAGERIEEGESVL